MKLNELKKAAAKAQQDLQLAEHKAAELQRSAKAAKAKTDQARIEHKRVRKAAKQAKKLVLAAEEQAREQHRAWEKAHRRLSKALKKLAKTKAVGAKMATEAAAKKLPPNTRKTQKPPVAGQSPPAGLGA
jgi:hypothetical protein